MYQKEREMIRKITLPGLLMYMGTMSGCHNVHGVGQDIEGGGWAIEGFFRKIVR
jgi:predicted small secreted protein